MCIDCESLSRSGSGSGGQRQVAQWPGVRLPAFPGSAMGACAIALFHAVSCR